MVRVDNKKKEHKLGLIVLILSIIICLTTVSYALWSRVYHGKKDNYIKTGTLLLKLDEKSSAISLENTIPTSDSNGQQMEPYTFSLQNTGTADAKFRILMFDDDEYYKSDNCLTKKLSWDKIRYSFIEDNTTPVIDNLSAKNGVLTSGTIKAGEENEYSLRLWLSKDTTEESMGLHFHGKIRVDAIQSDQALTD